MPDVQEVFRLATQKIDPEQGFLERQHHHQRRRTRNRKLGALALAGVIGLVAVIVVIRAADDGRGAQPAVQPTPTPEPSLTPPGAYLIDLNTGEMTPLPKSIAGLGYSVSPDGTMVAYTSLDFAGIFIANLDGTNVEQVTDDRRVGGVLDWSPDGGAIAFARRSGDGEVGNIFVLDLATGETSQVTKTKRTTEACCGPPGAAYPQFSPDGASIVYEFLRGDSFSVRIVPVTGGKSVLLAGGSKNDVEAWLPMFSPDGSTLAMGCSGRLEGICIANADGTNLHGLVSGPSLTYPKWSPDGTRIAYTDLVANPSKVFVVDVATGETAFVAEGLLADWLDDHTLIVGFEG
jgi:Tol biopolymer transport system component